MAVAALAQAPAKPSAARPPPLHLRPKAQLPPRSCDCGAPAGLSGHCAGCDRVSLRPRHAGTPEPAAAPMLDVGSLKPHASAPQPGFDLATLGIRSAVSPSPVVAIRQTSRVRVQAEMRVSQPADAAEQEATTIGRMVARMPAPTDGAGARPASHVGTGVVQREVAAANANHPADPDILAGLRAGGSSGSRLPRDLLSFMEPRFRADFSGVRIHTDQRAAMLSGQLGARAFTVGRDIYFGRNEFRPDRAEGWELIAHELTHTIQQGSAGHVPAAPPRAPAPAAAAAPRAAGPAPRAAAAAPVAAPPRGAAPAARTTTPPRAVPMARVAQRASRSIQRFGVSDALDFFAKQANLIMGFRMLTVVLGVNPINMAPVDRSAANVLRALVELIPGGGVITQALENSGIFDKAGAWVSAQIATLGMTGAALKQAVMDFLGSLSWKDIFHLGDVWERAKRIFTEPIDRLIDFVKGLVTGILQLIKDAILLPLAKLAEGTRGWDLLIGILGKNPITGATVARSAENLIGGFLKLIGQDEIWENMKKANAIQRAWAWFQGAMAALLGFVSQIPDLFIAAFKSLTIEDVVLVAGAFRRIGSVFDGFLVKFIDWAGTAIWNLLEIIFDVVSPGALTYVKKTGAALKSILKDPLPFVHNLVSAAKLGLQNFADHFGTHLKQGLIDWLTGSLQGVYIPQALSLVELGKFALSVLGITWAQIRAKIVKALGANGETIMKALETGFDIVVALIKGGIAAAWELIKEKLTNLKDMVVDGIVGFVTDTIIKKAIPKLVSLFIPGAGFISAILSIYDTIKVFIEKLAKMIAVVKAFVDSIVAIAAGQIAGAAARVESGLADVLSLAISFLAGFLGLGNITSKIMEVVHKVQAVVDKALDTAITWIVTKAKAFFAKAKAAVGGLFNWGGVKSSFTDEDGAAHSVSVDPAGAAPRLMVASTPQPAEQFLDVFLKGQTADYLKANDAKIQAVRAAINDAGTTIAAIDAGMKVGKDEAALMPLQNTLLKKNVTVSGALSALVGKNPLVGEAREHYLLEGITGTYGSIPKPKSDDLTADHQPQAAVLEAAAEFSYFSPTGELARRAAGRAQEGYAINLSTTRHKAGETFGSKGKVTKADFLNRVKPQAVGKPPAQQRQIVVGEIRSDMTRDANAMIKVAAPDPASPNWKDVLPAGDAKARAPVIKEISARIIAGEVQIKAQDIGTLVN